MSPEGTGLKTATEPADVFGPAGVGYGPVGIVRELARDLLRQRRMRADEAARVESALRTREWPTVRLCVEVALARRPESARPADTPRPAAAAPAAPSPDTMPTAPPACPQHAAAEQDAPGADVAAGLLRLVMRLCDGVARLSGDDRNFAQRLGPIRQALASRLTPERLVEAEAQITLLIEQQVAVCQNLHDARNSLKDMLGQLVERLGSVGDSTTRFGERIGAYQQALAGTPDAAAVLRVAGALLADTRQVSEQIHASQRDLAATRAKVESYERRVRILEQELAQTVRMVQNDPLTRAFNRRGLDEVFRVETARALRYRMPLVLAMIDLDDFKRINDGLGHAAGDRALVHFVTTAQACLRPTDAIARSGGEEFVMVLPATGVDEALEAVRRIQRELARSPFVHEERSVGLTFSGGIARWRPEETLDQVLRRADATMYEVKRKGKNLVELAPE